MYQIDVSMHLNADMARVFEAISDHAAFLSGGGVTCEVVSHGDPSPNGHGAIREVRSSPLVFQERITAYDAPNRYDYQILWIRAGGLGVPVRHEGGWMTCTPEGTGTRVHWCSTFRVTVPLVGRWLEPRIGRQFEATFLRFLTRADRALAA